jgi:hypothetical protein
MLQYRQLSPDIRKLYKKLKAQREPRDTRELPAKEFLVHTFGDSRKPWDPAETPATPPQGAKSKPKEISALEPLLERVSGYENASVFSKNLRITSHYPTKFAKRGRQDVPGWCPSAGALGEGGSGVNRCKAWGTKTETRRDEERVQEQWYAKRRDEAAELDAKTDKGKNLRDRKAETWFKEKFHPPGRAIATGVNSGVKSIERKSDSRKRLQYSKSELQEQLATVDCELIEMLNLNMTTCRNIIGSVTTSACTQTRSPGRHK